MKMHALWLCQWLLPLHAHDLNSAPELSMTDHHPAAPALPHRESAQLRQLFHVVVDQVPQPAGERREHEHTAQTKINKQIKPTFGQCKNPHLHTLQSRVVSSPRVVALLLVRLQLVPDLMQELTLVLRQVTVGFHRDGKTFRGVLLRSWD